MAKTQLIHIHPEAPCKPDWGVPCNGCGVCCLAEPCPTGQVMYLQRAGTCPALSWQDDAKRYVCGLVAAPAQHHWLIPKRLNRFAAALFRRWIASGKGCDSDAAEEKENQVNG